MQADTLLADNAFDGDEDVIEPLLPAVKKLVIRPKKNDRTFNAIAKRKSARRTT
jgi:hypothetical protein